MANLNPGEKYGRLTILNFAKKDSKTSYYLCRCDCGNEKIIRKSHIGKTSNSCGCLRLELLMKPKPHLQNDKSPNWKVSPGYRAIHVWVIKNKGKAKQCEKCDKTSGKIEWANIDHEYKRNLDDYIGLCTSCHRKYDIKFNGYGK
jgi:hypothetical protein